MLDRFTTLSKNGRIAVIIASPILLAVGLLLLPFIVLIYLLSWVGFAIDLLDPQPLRNCRHKPKPNYHRPDIAPVPTGERIDK